MRHFVVRLLPLAAACQLLIACGGLPQEEAGDSGAAQVVATSQALTPEEVDRVVLLVTGPLPGAANRSFDLVRVRGTWQGTVDKLPKGSYEFFVQAYDGSGLVIFSGRAEVEIQRNTTAQVNILLQQVDAPEPFENEAPIIESLVASAAEVAPGETVALQAAARDPNGDVMAFIWTATGGSFGAAADLSTTWTAPDTEGVYVLTFRAMDDKDASSSLSFQMAVAHAYGTGAGSTRVDFNTWPSVRGISASEGQIDLGETTTLSVTAHDVDGDTLTYAWSPEAGCLGTFDATASATTSFTLENLPSSGRCALSVQVTDGRGGETVGSVVIQTGPGAPMNVAPVIDSAFQASDHATGDETLPFGVKAHDPEGLSLTYTWSASAGTIHDQSDTATGSDVRWTAPPSFSEPATLTVVVADGSAATAYTFGIAPYYTVSVTSAFTRVYVGESLDLDATVADPHGAAVQPDLMWSSSDESRATVDGFGVMTAVHPGMVTLTAAHKGNGGDIAVGIVGAPTFPPPGGVISQGSGAPQGPGGPGGWTFQFSRFDLGASNFLAWGSDVNAPPKLSMDHDGLDEPGETLAFDATNSDLENGRLVWTGFAQVPSGAVAQTRLLINVSDGSATAISLLSPAEAGVPASVGGVIPIVSDHDPVALLVNVRFEARSGSEAWQPATVFFDRLPMKPPGVQIQTSFTGGFYSVP